MAYWVDDDEERTIQSTFKEFDLDEIVKEKMYDFLERTKKTVMRLDGFDPEKECYAVWYLPLLHRWKPQYLKRVLAKTYAINEWYKKHVPRLGVTMITFTTEQRDVMIPDQIEALRYSFNKIKKVMKKHLGSFSYLWVIEPHKTGYCHLHMLYFGSRIPTFIKKKIDDLWINKYHVARHHVNFEYSGYQRNLNNAGGYVFKYLSKTMDEKLITDRDSGYFLLASWVREMSRHDSRYNGVRMWGCSRDISDAMRYDKAVSPVCWFRVNLKTDTGWFPIWVSEDLWSDDGSTYIEKFDSWVSTVPADLSLLGVASL